VSLLESLSMLEDELTGLDPACLSGEDAAVLVEALSLHEKRCAALRLRAALRAIDCDAHTGAGEASGASWLAKRSGMSAGQARRDLETAAAALEHPCIADALGAGEISHAEAAEVLRGVEADPESEAELLAIAKNPKRSLRALRDAVREVIAKGEDRDERRARQHALRALRCGTDRDGMEWLEVRGAPGTLTHIINQVRARAERVFRQAYREGRREAPEAYAFDAFLELWGAGGLGKRNGHRHVDLTVVVDWAAFRRGHTHGEEICTIPGVGPVPVAFARDVAADAFLKGLLYEGVEVMKVAHYGRHWPAEVMTALMLGRPPGFEGVSCAEEGCDRRLGVEADHVEPFANGGPSALWNHAWRCRPHHRTKTRADATAGLLGPRPRGDPP
jgi:hypothetical protein